MAIKDGRILLDSADALTNWSFSGGGGGFGLALDPQTKYQGTNSITAPISTTLGFIFYDAGATQNWTNNEFYFLMQVGVIGDMIDPALSFRFTGATIGDFIQFKVASPTTWPATSVGNGWYQFVVDIEGTPDVTGGTIPNTNAIQRAGYVMDIGTMAKQDNTWIDALYRRPYTSPGIIIEGDNGGSPYTWQDVLDYTSTNEIATCIPGPGGSIVLSTPVQFGNTVASSTHSFSDTNQTILWDSQPKGNAAAYELNFVSSPGGSSTYVAGAKSGTGSDATGSQGWTVQAAGDSARWSLIANNTGANTNFYGCNFVHSNTINTESSNTEVISTFLIDGNEYVHSTTAGGSVFLRNSVINANTADGTAYVKSVDLDPIKYSTFVFSDGHAIEITTLGADLPSESFQGNLFSGYSETTNSTDASIYNDTGQDVVINASDGSNIVSTSYRNGTSATTTINNTVTVTIQNVILGSEVRAWDYSSSNTDIEIAGGTDSAVSSSVIFSTSTNLDLLIKVFLPNYNIERFVINSGSAGVNRRVDQTIDRVYSP